MQILFLGPKCNYICNFLQHEGHNIVFSEERLDIKSSKFQHTDLIISFGYRHIIPKEIIKKFQNKIINLHISLLPWNRGADPNLWSFLDKTPKGVTIHYIDEGIDTGAIISQREVFLNTNGTLRSTYNILIQEIKELFVQTWPDLIRKKIIPITQPKELGSFHSSSDKEKYEHLLTDGWDTPVSNLIGKAL